jgi:hypothetical protein
VLFWGLRSRRLSGLSDSPSFVSLPPAKPGFGGACL